MRATEFSYYLIASQAANTLFLNFGDKLTGMPRVKAKNTKGRGFHDAKLAKNVKHSKLFLLQFVAPAKKFKKLLLHFVALLLQFVALVHNALYYK